MSPVAKARLFRWLALTAATAFIAFFVGIVIIADRADGVPFWSFLDRIPNGDKLGHLCLIGTMSFLCNLAFPVRKYGWPTVTTLVLLLLLTGEELSQAFIPSRHLDFFDWLADFAGLALGQMVALKMRTLVRNAVKSPSTTAP